MNWVWSCADPIVDQIANRDQQRATLSLRNGYMAGENGCHRRRGRSVRDGWCDDDWTACLAGPRRPGITRVSCCASLITAPSTFEGINSHTYSPTISSPYSWRALRIGGSFNIDSPVSSTNPTPVGATEPCTTL